MARTIAAREGFSVTEAQAKARALQFPTRAQRNANPGNVREWHDAKRQDCPQAGGYVDFVPWASAAFPGASLAELGQKALAEGWRVLRKLVSQYVEGKYTGKKVPTLREVFAVCAPATDRDDPDAYAQFVAHELGVSALTPFDKLLEA